MADHPLLSAYFRAASISLLGCLATCSSYSSQYCRWRPKLADQFTAHLSGKDHRFSVGGESLEKFAGFHLFDKVAPIHPVDQHAGVNGVPGVGLA
jgi:hypothetical protein